MQKHNHFLLMKNNNILQLQIRNVFLLSAIVVLLSITSITVAKVHAITTSSVIPNSNSNNNNNNTAASLGIAAIPFYEAKIGKIIGQRIVSVAANGTPPKIEQSIIENGALKGVGNVTSLGTWTNTFRSPTIVYGVGQGIITTADGQDMATWTGFDIGRSNIKGVITYHGISFFNTNSTGKLAFLKNLEALHTTEVDGNKQTTEMWEWK